MEDIILKHGDKESQVIIHFDKRKNDQLREGSEVVILGNKEKTSACIYTLFGH